MHFRLTYAFFITILLGVSMVHGQAPVWEWVVEASGTGNETAVDVAVDSNSHTSVVVGNFVSRPAQYTGISASYGNMDGFVAKYDAAGNVLWAFNIGGTGQDSITSVAIDPAGFIYIAGRFNSPVCNFQGSSGSNFTLNRNPGGGDAFIAKYSPNGSLSWAVGNAGGNGEDMAVDISANASGVFVTGYYTGSFSFGAWTAAHASGNQDFFLAHLSPLGNLVWGVDGGCTDNSSGVSVHATAAGVFLAGHFTGLDTLRFYNSAGLVQPAFELPNLNPFKQSIFLVSLTNSGIYRWTDLIGGTQDCMAGTVLQYGDGLYLTGGIDKDASFPGTSVLYGPKPMLNLFVSRHDTATGGTVWVADPAGKMNSYGNGLAVDGNGNLVAAGYHEDTLDFTLQGGPQLLGNNDIVIAAFNTAGTFEWFKTASSAGVDIAHSISMPDSAGHNYLVGEYQNTAGFDSILLPDGPGMDAWVGKLRECDASIDYGASLFCQSGSVVPNILGVSGGVFSEMTGSVVFSSTATGEVNLAASTPGGPYDIVYAWSTCADTFQISIQALPTVDLGGDSTVCAPNTVLLDAGNSGAGYTWSTGAMTQTINAGATGTYAVTVTQGICSASDTVNIVVTPLPTLTLPNDTSFCAPDSLLLDAGNSGAFFDWSTGSTAQTIYVGQTGNYVVTVTQNGCSVTDDINVTVFPQLTVNLGNDTTFCSPNTVTLDAGNSGASFLWSTGAASQTISVNATGTYSVTVTAGSCSATDTINVTILPPPTVNLGNDTILCAPSSLTLDAGNSGATYAWSTGDTTQTISVNATGTYSVTVTAGICSTTDSIDVAFLPSPAVNLGNDTTLCAPNTLTLDAGNSGASYLWSTGATAQTISVNATGNYSVTVTAGSCSASDDINITIAPTPSVDLGNDTTLCIPNTITLDAGNSGGTYAWSTGAATQTISINATGTYSVTVTAGSCSATDTIDVTILPPPTANLGNDTTLCTPNTLLLDAGNSGATYLWSTGATTQTISVSAAGNYSVTVTAGSCTDSDDINIATAPTPTVDLGSDTTLCAGLSLTLDAANPGNGVLWSNGATSQSITVTSTGLYAVTITTPQGCTGNDEIQVTFEQAMALILDLDSSYCETDPAVSPIGVPAGGNFSGPGIAGGAFTPSNAPLDLPFAITYTYTSPTGCISTTDQSITVSSTPLVDAGEDREVYFTSDALLTGSSPANSATTWVLTSGEGSISAPNSLETTANGLGIGPNSFLLTAISEAGCIASDQITLTVIPFKPERAFSPNGDNINDRFVIPGLEEFPGSSLSIFNRWGQEVYESPDYQNDWDGRGKNGNQLPSDTYFYILGIDQRIEIKGHVALQR